MTTPQLFLSSVLENPLPDNVFVSDPLGDFLPQKPLFVGNARFGKFKLPLFPPKDFVQAPAVGDALIAQRCRTF